jgi:hypothetical protein
VATQVAVAFFFGLLLLFAHGILHLVSLLLLLLQQRTEEISQSQSPKETEKKKNPITQTQHQQNKIQEKRHPLTSSRRRTGQSTDSGHHVRYNKQNKHWINNEWLIDWWCQWTHFVSSRVLESETLIELLVCESRGVAVIVDNQFSANVYINKTQALMTTTQAR